MQTRFKRHKLRVFVVYKNIYNDLNKEMSGILTTGKLVLTNTTSNQDAFDRLRVSQTYTMYDVATIYDSSPHRLDTFVNGTGAVTHDSKTGVITLSANASTNAVAIQQSYRYISYQFHKSRIVLLSGTLRNETSTAEHYCRTRVGLFDGTAEKGIYQNGVTNPNGATGPGNGHYFELVSAGNGSTDIMFVVERRGKVDGVGAELETETRIEQTNWNIDKFNGGGPSGFTISSWRNSAFVFVIDQQWGAGRVRFGLYICGTLYYMHHLTHAAIGVPAPNGTYNPGPIIIPYIRYPKLPIRSELKTTSDAGQAASMSMMCMSVMSESGREPAENPRSLSWPFSDTKAIPTATGFIPLLSFTLPPVEPANRITLSLTNFAISSTGTNSSLMWSLIQHPRGSLVGATYSTISSYSHALYNSNGSSTFTNGVIDASTFLISNGANGIVLDSGILASDGNISKNYLYASEVGVDSFISGEPKVLTIAVRSLTGTQQCSATLSWIEIKN